MVLSFGEGKTSCRAIAFRFLLEVSYGFYYICGLDFGYIPIPTKFFNWPSIVLVICEP